MSEEKVCTKCGESKPTLEFHKNYKNNDGLHYHCKKCRKNESLKQYDMTLSDYDKMLEKQGGRCKICSTDTPRGQSTAGRFYVDHNHETGEVRGLLCNDCNTGIGLLKDSPLILSKAIEYLMTNGHYGDNYDF